MLSDAEAAMMEQIGQLEHAFARLPGGCQDDRNEFLFHIHALQNLVLSRCGFRALCKREQGKEKQEATKKDGPIDG